MPVINITSSEKGSNKGSSSALANYLEKENNDKPKESHELWFNATNNQVAPQEVVAKIDNNKKGLKDSEAKFFLVNVAPSEKELKFLIDKFGPSNLQESLKHYANQVMDVYAKNFKRAGVNGGAELVYFGKIEQHRYHTHEDPEVRNGLAKKGDKKAGENWHAQIIVSRKDVSQKFSLSPLNNSSGKNSEFSAKFGQFNMRNLKLESERIFDKTFDYKRAPQDSFLYLNTQKNGSTLEKASLMALEAVSTAPMQIQNYQSINLGGDILGSLASIFLSTRSSVNSFDKENEAARKKRKYKGHRF